MAKAHLFILMALLLFLGCTSDSKFVSLNPDRPEVEPAKAIRTCKSDGECRVVDVDCDSCCPGGGAINSKFLSVFRKTRDRVCSSKKLKARTDCTCVMAPVKCLSGLCTWAYEGPDPHSL